MNAQPGTLAGRQLSEYEQDGMNQEPRQTPSEALRTAVHLVENVLGEQLYSSQRLALAFEVDRLSNEESIADYESTKGEQHD